jgi:serine/threonine-protein kinase
VPTLIGRQIGQYHVLSLLGHGGMATVYRARQASVEREVAIKFLPESLAADSTLRARFAQEAKTIAALQHPHILPLFDYGEDDGQPYLVMRLVDGGSLDDRLQAGRMPEAEILRLAEQIAAALDYAHARQVIHRDLKPGNILLDTHGEAYLSDFGIAKLLSSTQNLTGSGLIGTPHYMAPEQIRGQADARVDVYALGVIVYQALVGEMPYSGDTFEVLNKKLTEPPRPPVELIPDFSPALEAVLLKALALDLDERYASAGELARDLRAAMAGLHDLPTREHTAASTRDHLASPTEAATPLETAAGVAAFTEIAPTRAAVSSPTAVRPSPASSPLRWIIPAAALGGVVLVVAIAALGFTVRALFAPPAAPTALPRIIGEFNIAVAEFAVVDESGQLSADAGLITAQQIFRRVDAGVLEASRDSDVEYQVWSPEQVGVVTGETPEARAEAAAQLAQTLGAQIIVYGVARAEGAAQIVEPAFYVSEDSFALTPEFIGVHRLGGAITLGGGGDFASRVQTNRAIADRSQALGLMAVGLEKFALADYETASALFEKAASLEGWPDEDGKEAIYLMLGNASLRLEQLPEAESFFKRGLDVNPDYARAHVGLAAVYYQRAFGQPVVKSADQINQADLALAEEEYSNALNAADRPASAEIGVKVNLGLGLIAFTRYQIAPDPTQQRIAQSQFQTVVDAYEASQSARIREHAGLAYAQLGTLAFLERDYARAEAAYLKAIEIVNAPRARAGYYALLANLYRTQGQTEQARAALEQAVAVAPEDAKELYQQQLDELK